MRPPAAPARPPSLVRVEWAQGARIGGAARREVERVLETAAAVVSDCEAEVDAIARRVACGFEWLLPTLEMTVPLYGRKRILKLRIRRDEDPGMVLETRTGRRVGVVTLR